ncbi:unnamed protein product [Ambrosiozyma monospora]|uniref:Unnamed protein product n=1 Tax=Ambrosiozyma monospora TaxID=43982 RepID=A0A9W7DIC6_AMBMO|nr:unnamed protein product [Ambrosiozyma monospora]
MSRHFSIIGFEISADIKMNQLVKVKTVPWKTPIGKHQPDSSDIFTLFCLSSKPKQLVSIVVPLNLQELEHLNDFQSIHKPSACPLFQIG